MRRNTVTGQDDEERPRIWSTDTLTTSQSSAQARHRASLLLAERRGEIHFNTQGQAKESRKEDVVHMRKRPRRRTIYVPPEDTTIFTIHPGARSENAELSCLSLYINERNGGKTKLSIDNSYVQVQELRRCAPTTAPKRAPLQPTLKPLQKNEASRDNFVSGLGKENIPPNVEINPSLNDTIKMSKARRVPIFAPSDSVTIAPSRLILQRFPEGANRASRNTLKLADDPCKVERTATRNPRDSVMNRRNSLYYGLKSIPKAEAPSQNSDRLPMTSVAPLIATEALPLKKKYSIVQENITHPEMFEDSWLSNQESAIQQVINSLFKSASSRDTNQLLNHEEIRKPLLQLYQGPECLLIYRRLQASLLYGALNPPRVSIATKSSLTGDLGLRQRFTAIWLETYDVLALKVAAEVIVGRELRETFSDQSPSHAEKDVLGQKGHREKTALKTTTRLKRRLSSFLVAFLLRNEDASEADRPSPSSTCSWRRTVLRCLMLVVLLDQAKRTGLLSGNLFQATSRFKSSQEVLNELSGILSPSIGDISRLLSLLGFRVQHTQFPLSERRYAVEKLATDLRDGIQLTHLVELLVYPPGSLTRLREDLTIAMPTGEVLITSVQDEQSWVLSQHLKIPCPARTQKIYNVQVALSALHGIHGIGSIAQGLTAEDIVDGHREKTIALLWGLVGTWGLDSLVDFKELRKEVRRTKDAASANQDHDSDSDDEDDDNTTMSGLERRKHLLKAWARNIAQYRSNSKVLNLTTSFANGKIFAAIVDEYRQFMPEQSLPRQGNGSYISQPLDAKLIDIGCSTSFGKLHHSVCYVVP